jgi:hypothetical protein
VDRTPAPSGAVSEPTLVPQVHAQPAPARSPARALPPVRSGLRLYDAHRYQVVFYTLLATLVMNPLLPVLGFDSGWLTLFVALNVLAAVFGAVEGRTGKAAILALTLLALVVSNLPDTIAARSVTNAAFTCWMLVTAFAVATSVRYALKQDDVGREHLYAALSAYLLVGVLFAELYLALERTFPGSLGPGRRRSRAVPIGRGDVFQLRHAGHARLRRHRAADRVAARRRGGRGGHRPALHSRCWWRA